MLDAVGEASDYAGISASGHAVFLSGERTQPVQVRSDGKVNRAWGTDSAVRGSEEIQEILRRHYLRQGNTANAFENDIAASRRRAVLTTEELALLMDNADLGEPVRIEGNRLSQQLGTIANLIQVRSDLGPRRQIFFAQIGGWDTHRNQFEVIPELLSQVSEALSGFQGAMDRAGLADQVTLFTASDFGRTLISNATGTDHGWGSHHIVMGGAVRGGRIAGEVPVFDKEHDHDFRRGSLIPSLATEQYGSEIGRWFGLSESDLDVVFPNRGRFSRDSLGLFA
jgi:uncharacterized protein (DUF1501 family)